MDIMLKAREFASVLQTDGVKGGKAFIENLFSDENANIGAIFAVLSLIVMGVLMYVGISIMAGVDNAISIDNTSAFYATKTSIVTGINSGFSMVTVLMIVVISTAVLASLFGIFVLFQNRNVQQ